MVSKGDQYDSQPIPIHGLSQDGVWRCEPSYHSVEECGGENYTHGWRFCILEYREYLHRSLGLYRTLPTLCDSLWDATPTLVSTREVHWYQQLQLVPRGHSSISFNTHPSPIQHPSITHPAVSILNLINITHTIHISHITRFITHLSKEEGMEESLPISMK